MSAAPAPVRKDRRGRRTGAALIELLVVLALVAVLAALVLPVYMRGKSRATETSCLANLRQLTQAARMYEADHGALPVHMGVGPEHWVAKLEPYVRANDDPFVCPLDPTRGRIRMWGGNRRCSYLFMYTRVHLGPGESYREPAPTSPLIMCKSHPEYQCILARYDGSIELPPPRRYHELKPLF